MTTNRVSKLSRICELSHKIEFLQKMGIAQRSSAQQESKSSHQIQSGHLRVWRHAAGRGSVLKGLSLLERALGNNPFHQEMLIQRP
jgi:hypothetical protein